MSENDFDVQRQRAQDERDDLVLTGEEIELPGEDSDASAIIGESSAPIHTGEIESVARSRRHRRFLRRHGDGGRGRARAGRCARPGLARRRAGLSRSHAFRRIGALGGAHPER